MQASNKHTHHNEKKILHVLMVLNLFNYIHRYIISSLITPIKESLLLSDTEIGRLSTVFMIGYVISCPIFGYWGDKHNRKKIILLSVLVWLISTFYTGYFSAFYSILICRFIVGFGQAGFSTVAPSWIADFTVHEKQNKVLTWFYAAIPVGSALGFIFGGLFNKYSSWQNAFTYSALFGLIPFFMLGFTQENHLHTESHNEQKFQLVTWRNILSLLKIKKYNLTCWGYTAYNFAIGALAFWGPTFVHRHHRLEQSKASIYFGGILVVTGFLGTIIGGQLAEHFKHKRKDALPIVCSISIIASIPFALLAFWTESLFVSLSSLTFAMLFAFMCTGPINALVIQTSPKNLKASGMAISIFLLHVFGDMFSSELVGFATDQWNRLNVALSLLTIPLLIAGLLWFLLAIDTSKGSSENERTS